MSIKLSDIQKRRLAILKPQFDKAIFSKDLQIAKIVLNDIQSTLNLNNHTTLLAQYRNWFFELALDSDQYALAESGFISVRRSVSKNTRIHLEATALLAICYLRLSNVEKAKPLIKEVLHNDHIIKTERTRRVFNKNIIQRFDEEVALYSLKGKYGETYDYKLEEIEKEVGVLVSTKSEDELFKLLGSNVPETTKSLLYEVDSFAKNLLPFAERNLLASPEDIIKNEEVGKTVFTSFKRTIYNSICDQNSQVYKMWNEKVVGAVLNSKYIIGAVAAALSSISIGFHALIITAAALVIRFGLDIYCEHYKPKGIMATRKD
jgi:hypothetical protein